MIKSYLNPNEFVYFNKKYKGKKYSRDSLIYVIIGLIIFALACYALVLSILISFKFLLIFFLCLVVSLSLFILFNKLNRKYFDENDILYLEYAITNQRFILFDIKTHNFYDIPITYFNNFLVRDNSNPNFPSSLILNSNYSILSKIRLEIANSDLEISENRIVINSIKEAYIVKNQLKLLQYMKKNNIDDIHNVDCFLEQDEKILHADEYRCDNIAYDDKLIKIVLVAFPIFLVLFVLIGHFYAVNEYYSTIMQFLSVIYVLILIYKGKSIRSNSKNKNKKIDILYFFTNKRILFFDYSNLILYCFKYDYLEFININNYNKETDTGDIFLSNYQYYLMTKSINRSSSSNRDTRFIQLFPNNYSEHNITYDLDVMNCPRIRLYDVKNPNYVVDKYLKPYLRDLNDLEKEDKEKFKEAMKNLFK